MISTKFKNEIFRTENSSKAQKNKIRAEVHPGKPQGSSHRAFTPLDPAQVADPDIDASDAVMFADLSKDGRRLWTER